MIPSSLQSTVSFILIFFTFFAACLPLPLAAAETVEESESKAFVLFPNNRDAYYASETVELAVAGLPAGEKAVLRLVPAAAEDDGPTSLPSPVETSVTGDGSTVTLTFQAHAFAPGAYTIELDGVAQKRGLTIAHGVPNSTMRMSQTRRKLEEVGGNFFVGHQFETGLTHADGSPRTSFHGPKDINESRSLKRNSELLAESIPNLIYMYWTGHVLHKPWGINKSWANEDMVENMRLFNFSAAQTLRRYAPNLLTVGPIDEPGLAWGKTPAGGMASGFPNWDEQPWYEGRGWNFTNDITSRGKEDFLDYLRIRTRILRENYQWAKEDFQSVYPEVVWGGDLYAPHAIMDGTDPFNQVVNDVVTTHVFSDWGMGKFSIIGASYLEKAHDPLLPVAHAMNGQLFGPRNSANTSYAFPDNAASAYFMTLNAMLASGMKSNWWLNTKEITAPDLKRINEAAMKMGPIFLELRPTDHPVAVLWSYTNLGLLQYELARKESTKETGEQILLMVSDAPEISEFVDAEEGTPINAYSVGGGYKYQVLWTYSALNRAGYPAHVLHEDLLADGALQNYKVLAVPGLVHPLPGEVMAALKTFTDDGGVLLADKSTTIELPGMIRVDADFSNAQEKWALPFQLQKKVEDGKDSGHTLREASYFQTNAFMENFNRTAAPAFKTAMAETGVEPVLVTDSVDLGVERHTGGEGQLFMVINANDLPPREGPEDQAMPIYNYAPLEATYSLQGIPAGSVVYKIEGLGWDRVSLLKDPAAEMKESFEPAEMKLFLVAPRAPEGLTLRSSLRDGAITATASLDGLKMPWPLQVRLTAPDGSTIYEGWRATDDQGSFTETFPIGKNAPAGDYTVSLTSPVADLKATAKTSVVPASPQPAVSADKARVFDEETLRDFLGAKPSLTIAIGKYPAHRAAADQLAEALKAKGIKAAVQPEGKVMRKVLYPRVWDPFAKVLTPTAEIKPLPEVKKRDEKDRPIRDEDGKPIMVPGTVARELNIQSDFYGSPTVTTSEGDRVTDDWRTPGTLLTVGGKGFIDTFGPGKFVEPGVQIFVGERKKLVYLNSETVEMKTTGEFRAKWSRPWQRIMGYNGGFNLTPQLPQAWTVDDHLILLGDSSGSELVAALQAAEILPQYTDTHYPGPGKSLVSYAWSPFGLEKNVILIGAADPSGLQAGVKKLLSLLP